MRLPQRHKTKVFVKIYLCVLVSGWRKFFATKYKKTITMRFNSNVGLCNSNYVYIKKSQAGHSYLKMTANTLINRRNMLAEPNSLTLQSSFC